MNNICSFTGKPCHNNEFSSADVLDYFYNGHSLTSIIQIVTALCGVRKKHSCKFVESAVLSSNKSTKEWKIVLAYLEAERKVC